jgi:FG-GAP-like repeat/Secretion system C-terminal sorting domain
MGWLFCSLLAIVTQSGINLFRLGASPSLLLTECCIYIFRRRLLDLSAMIVIFVDIYTKFNKLWGKIMRPALAVVALLVFVSTSLAQFGPEIQFNEWMYEQNDVVLADMDDDGDLDLLYDCMWNDNGGLNFVGWLERAGADTIRHEIAHGFLASDFQPADMDGDGDLDVVMGANAFLAWYENTGTDTWLQHMVDDSLYAWDVRPADLDQDGDIDIVTRAEHELCWHENTGDGWTYHNLYPSRQDDVDLADMDGDGDIDIVSSRYSVDIIWWENVDAEFTYHVVYDEIARDIDAVDIDGDGDMDLVGTGNGVVIYENVDWVWTRNLVLSFEPGHWSYQSITGDLEGDGDLDIITLFDDYNQNYPSIIEIRQDGGNWSYGAVTFDLDSPSNVQLADLNADGLLDIVAASDHDNEIAWFDQHADSWEKKLIQSNGSKDDVIHQEAVDWDADGDTDFMELLTDPGRIAVYEHRNNRWIGHRIIEDIDDPDYATPCDLDGDGDMDVLVVYNDWRVFAWYEAVGVTYIYHFIDDALREPMYHGFRYVLPGNLDEDDGLEILVYRDQFLVRYDWNGDQWDRSLMTTFTNQFGPDRGELVDLDQDGDLDLVTEIGGLRCYENDGLDWVEHGIYQPGNGPVNIKTGDINNDGYPDILYQHARELELFINEGEFSFSMSGVVTFSFGFDLADVDGDSDLDLAASYKVDDHLYNSSLFLWDGVGFVETILDETRYSDIYFGDYEADGDLDMFVKRWDGYAWRENLFPTAPTAHAATGTTMITIADLEPAGLPGQFALSAPYPNPFNASAIATLALPQPNRVRVTLLNILGQEVGVLVDGFLSGGRHTVSLNAETLPSGVYLLRAETDAGQSLQRKVTVLR